MVVAKDREDLPSTWVWNMYMSSKLAPSTAVVLPAGSIRVLLTCYTHKELSFQFICLLFIILLPLLLLCYFEKRLYTNGIVT